MDIRAVICAVLAALTLASCSPRGSMEPPDTAGPPPQAGATDEAGPQKDTYTPPEPQQPEPQTPAGDARPDAQTEPEDPPDEQQPDGGDSEQPPDADGQETLDPQEPVYQGPEPEDDELVYIIDFIPSIYIDLKYATEDNFVGQMVYDFVEPRLRYGTVKKLMAVQQDLAVQGYSLKIWDAYRPRWAQYALWEICPDSRFVANPDRGSTHSRGGTVDITLVLSDGTEIPMPTGFDDFTDMADRDYSDVPEDAASNARLLESVMAAHGFTPYSAEWWHYTDTVTYPMVEDGE